MIVVSGGRKVATTPMQNVENLKHVTDALSITVVVAALVSWLPALAALASLIWSVIRILETKTVQRLIDRFRKRR
jgi:hypothetical protein